jgi:catechol 2,3-dioxygenase-like lactoylglutathione lyase family enzyme
MAVQLTKDSIDLGIVIRDSDRSLAFYRDTLGLEHVADMPVPGGATMHRLACGTTVVKLVKFEQVPQAANPPGGLVGATGIRYFTLSVGNLDEVLSACEQGGYKMIWKKREIRPGVFVGMVEDPDGNWVEFLSGS